MLEIIKQNPVTAAIVIGGILLAAAGVVVGLIFFYDRGFMKRNGKKLHWEKVNIPLRLRYTEQLPSYVMSVVTLVVQQINKRVGFELVNPKFEKWETDSLTPVHILVDLHDEDEETELHWHKETGALYSAKIRIYPGWHREAIITHIRHGFGHAFGLRHDDKKSSVMHPYSEGRSKDFTDRDIERLKKQYG